MSGAKERTCGQGHLEAVVGRRQPPSAAKRPADNPGHSAAHERSCTETLSSRHSALYTLQS